MFYLRRPQQFYFGWIIVGLAFCSLAFWFGIRISFSVFYVTLSSEFPWGAGPLAGAQAIALVAAMASAPLIGALIDRYGPRKIILPGILMTSAGLMLCATMSSLLEFYVYYGIIAGSAITAVGVVSYSVVLRHWFRQKRGFASGFAVSGMGAGMLVFVPLVQHSISTWGWRNAFLILGALGGLFLFPATFGLLRLKAPPTSTGPLIDGDPGVVSTTVLKGNSTRKPLSADLSLYNTLKAKTFWHFLLFSFFASVGVYIILVHSVKFLVETGTDGMVAAVLLALVGAISSVFRILWGWLSDRIGREPTYSIGCASACLGIGCLLLLNGSGIATFAYAFTILFGIGWGATAPSVMASSADIFDGQRYGLIFGLVQAVINLAGAIGAWLGGALFERYQSYDAAFLISMAAWVLSCLFIWMAAPRKKFKATWQGKHGTEYHTQEAR